MELIDYWHFIRKWFVLIAGGTIVAAILSYGVLHLRERHAAPTYQSTSAVLVHYVLPFGTPYNPTVSSQVETVALKQHATESATLAAVARSTHISLRSITSVTALADPTTTRITLQVDSHSRADAARFAQGLAIYLADLQSNQVQQESGRLQHILAGQVAAARAKWIESLTHYNLVLPQLTAHPTAQNLATRAQLQATLDALQQDYQSLNSDYESLMLVPLAAATVEQGQNSTVAAAPPSTLRTVLAATIVGFFLMIGLAALLDYVGIREHQRARVPISWRLAFSRFGAARPAQQSQEAAPSRPAPVRAREDAG